MSRGHWISEPEIQGQGLGWRHAFPSSQGFLESLSHLPSGCQLLTRHCFSYAIKSKDTSSFSSIVLTLQNSSHSSKTSLSTDCFWVFLVQFFILRISYTRTVFTSCPPFLPSATPSVCLYPSFSSSRPLFHHFCLLSPLSTTHAGPWLGLTTCDGVPCQRHISGEEGSCSAAIAHPWLFCPGWDLVTSFPSMSACYLVLSLYGSCLVNSIIEMPWLQFPCPF